MKIDLSPIIKETGSKLNIDITDNIDISKDGIILTKPVTVKASITNTGKSFLVKGTVTTELSIQCGRCLKEFNYPLEFELEEQYCKSVKDYKTITGEVELTEEDFVYLLGEDNTIDLYEVLRQNIILRMPLKAVCSIDCKGIPAPKQEEKEIDPRLAKLKEFKERHLNDKK